MPGERGRQQHKHRTLAAVTKVLAFYPPWRGPSRALKAGRHPASLACLHVAPGSRTPTPDLHSKKVTVSGPVVPLSRRIVGGLCASDAGFGPLQRFFMKLQDFACAGNAMDTGRNRPAQGGRQ